MAFSQVTALAQVRTLVAQITALPNVYSVSETGDNKLPEKLDRLPAVLILDGPIHRYLLQGGGHRCDYEVRIQIFVGDGDLGDRAASVSPLVFAIIDKFVGNVSLGGRVNSFIFERTTGLQNWEYPPGGGVFYTGNEVIFQCSEAASATPAPGA
jgi:hypothetical protein